MKLLPTSVFISAALVLTACSDGTTTAAPASTSEISAGLIGDWQSLEDAGYLLKFDPDSYREFYENEEVSRDQWQPVKSCDEPQRVEKTAAKYGGFQIWTKPTDSRICYTISDWTADAVSLTYAGTTASYKRAN